MASSTHSWPKMKTLNIYEVSSPEELDAVIKRAPGRVILKFHRPDCPACMRMASTWLDMARRPNYRNVTFVGVNSSDNPELARAFNIEYLPTFMSLERGVKRGSFSGANPERLMRLIETGSS